MDQLWTYLQDQVQANHFLSGGAVLMVIGGLAAICRRLPLKAWKWTVRRLFLQFEIPIRDDAFWWFDEWLSRHPYSQRRARWLSIRTVPRGRRDDTPPKIIMSPAPGTHWLFWGRYFLIVNRDRKEDQTDANQPSSPVRAQREFFNVSILTQRRDVLRRLLEEAREIVIPHGDVRVNVFFPGYGGVWCCEAKRRPRPIESVILREGVLTSLIDDVEEFIKSETWYVDRGIPYRRGYLLHGPPGGGKSSAVLAIASHLRLDISVLSLNESSLSDGDVRSLLASVPENSMILIEDIDCVFAQRDGSKDKDNKVTFSGLLNAIDGITSSEGRILFMTTNHPNKLDPALIRPGRCDVKQFIGFADYTQAVRLFDRFFPDAPARLGHKFATGLPERTSMADLQGHLLKHRADPEAATNRSTNESEAADHAGEASVRIQADEC